MRQDNPATRTEKPVTGPTLLRNENSVTGASHPSNLRTEKARVEALPLATVKAPKNPKTLIEAEIETAPLETVPLVVVARSLPEAIRKNVAGVLAVEARVAPSLRFPGDAVVVPRPLLDWSRPEERHSEAQSTRKESEEDGASRSGKTEGERKREPEKSPTPVKEKAPEAPKAAEAKPQQPQRQLQKAITGGSGGGGDKEAAGPSAAERAETVKKMSEQFQMSPGKPEMQRNAPMMTPLPGQAPAPAKEQSKTTAEPQTAPKENAPTPSNTAKSETTTTTTTAKTETPTRGESKAEPSEKGKAAGDSGPTRTEGGREKAESTPQENLRRATQAARETERGEDFTGMRRSAGYQQAKGEMDGRHHNTPREVPTSNTEPGELRQSHSSQSSHGEGEGRGNQEKPGEEMQQRSDRGERQQRRRQNGQGGLETESEEEEVLLELEERAS